MKTESFHFSYTKQLLRHCVEDGLMYNTNTWLSGNIDRYVTRDPFVEHWSCGWGDGVMHGESGQGYTKEVIDDENFRI